MAISINRTFIKCLICSCLLLLSVASMAMAQALGSNRGPIGGEGSNTIQGRVYFPSNEQKGKAVKLHLETNLPISSQSATTDQDGVFRFNGLPPGTYTVVVDGGKEYESSRETVTIEPIGGSRVSQVNIILRPKVDANNEAFAGIPKPALEAYQKGNTALQKSDFKTAAQFLNEAVTAAPTFAMAYSDLGSAYEKLFQWGKAAEAFRALVKLKPTDATAQNNLGIALYNEGDELMRQQKYEDAEKKFNEMEAVMRESIKLKDTSVPHYYLGLMLIKFKTYEEAQKELELAISHGGENTPLYHKMLGGVYMSTHKNKQAADELEKYLKLEPNDKSAEQIRTTIKDLRSKP